jgi:iron complex transport system permease protein
MGLTVPPLLLWMISSVLFNLFSISFSHSGEILLFFYIILLLFVFLFMSRMKFFDFFSSEIVMVGITANLGLAAIFSFIQFIFMIQGKQLPHQLWVAHFKYIDGWGVLVFTLIFVFILFPWCLNLTKKLQLLIFGKDFLSGIMPQWIQWKKGIFFYLLFASGVAVLLGGNFSFWGLVMPHFLRKLSMFKNNLLSEAIYGGILAGLLLAVLDLLCYSFPFKGAEIPVGSITAILGPLFFIYVFQILT